MMITAYHKVFSVPFRSNVFIMYLVKGPWPQALLLASVSFTAEKCT